jgi:hypothetical protein
MLKTTMKAEIELGWWHTRFAKFEGQRWTWTREFEEQFSFERDLSS